MRHGGDDLLGASRRAMAQQAAVMTSTSTHSKGPWLGATDCRGKKVGQISAYLSEREEWRSQEVESNERNGFIGSLSVGEPGLSLTTRRHKGCSRRAQKPDKVVFPYLNGRI